MPQVDINYANVDTLTYVLMEILYVLQDSCAYVTDGAPLATMLTLRDEILGLLEQCAREGRLPPVPTTFPEPYPSGTAPGANVLRVHVDSEAEEMDDPSTATLRLTREEALAGRAVEATLVAQEQPSDDLVDGASPPSGAPSVEPVLEVGPGPHDLDPAAQHALTQANLHHGLWHATQHELEAALAYWSPDMAPLAAVFHKTKGRIRFLLGNGKFNTTMRETCTIATAVYLLLYAHYKKHHPGRDADDMLDMRDWWVEYTSTRPPLRRLLQMGDHLMLPHMMHTLMRVGSFLGLVQLHRAAFELSIALGKPKYERIYGDFLVGLLVGPIDHTLRQPEIMMANHGSHVASVPAGRAPCRECALLGETLCNRCRWRRTRHKKTSTHHSKRPRTTRARATRARCRSCTTWFGSSLIIRLG